MKKLELKKNERFRNLWDNLKHSNMRNLGMPEGEEEEQEIENLFEKIMKKNFSNLAEELDFRKSRKLRESQRSWAPGSTYQGTS